MNNKNKEFPDNLDIPVEMKDRIMIQFQKMNDEEKRRCITQSKLMNCENRMSQLVDRIDSNSFQG